MMRSKPKHPRVDDRWQVNYHALEEELGILQNSQIRR